ncbi:MAG TPA: hypothetical protein VN626_09520, partial [Clostridia bacterium]|nr:hypothetical protein [Clostridia bacterium]
MAAAGINCKEELFKMQIAQSVSLLLEKKQELFLEFERYTNLLTTCDIDDMANYITKRATIANEIDNVTDQITELIKTSNVTPSAEAILSISCSYSEVPIQWQPAFLEAQKISGIVARCVEVNQQAQQRMYGMRDHLKDRIVQTKNTPRIIKYLSSSGAIQQERS